MTAGNGTGSTGAVVRRRKLGRALRELREAAGLSVETAAPRLDWSASKLSRIENGQQAVDVHGVHHVLVLCRINRLSHIDRATGEPVCRYGHPHPGDLMHVDVKKLGNIPDGGGWRFVGRAEGTRHRAATPDKPRNRHRNPKMGTGFLHTVLNDHSRAACTEMCDDETAATTIAVLHRAVAWFATRGVSVRAVLTDNGACYRSHLWRDTCAELGITPRRTRPHRPQTNGKVERFHRTLVEGWAFRRLYTGACPR